MDSDSVDVIKLNRRVVFLCGENDFHAMDKVRATVRIVGSEQITVFTDYPDWNVRKEIGSGVEWASGLVNVSAVIRDGNSSLVDAWRNIVKLMMLPVQSAVLRHRMRKRADRDVVHAIPMYYMMVAYFAGLEYYGTPQGSEILVRCERSFTYRTFARFALHGAKKVVVDSVSMQTKIRSLFGLDSVVIKNGFDTLRAIRSQVGARRKGLLSMRSAFSNYRISEIVKARDGDAINTSIDFVFPAFDEKYYRSLLGVIASTDRVLGTVTKDDLYSLMGTVLLAVSIPASDSSPRSVYEAIFCGCAVAVSHSGYVGELPECMRARIIEVDINAVGWLAKAIATAECITREPYVPSMEALMMCEESLLIRQILENVYSFDLR